MKNFRVYAVHDITGFFSDSYATFTAALNETPGIDMVSINLTRYEELTELPGAIEELAEEHLKHYTSDHPTNMPIVFLGHSSGGLIAYEMAIQSLNKGVKVFVYMLDSHSQNLLFEMSAEEKEDILSKIKRAPTDNKQTEKRLAPKATAKRIFSMEQNYSPGERVPNAHLYVSTDTKIDYPKFSNLGWENLKHQIVFAGTHLSILNKNGKLFKHIKRQLLMLRATTELIPTFKRIKRDYRQQFKTINTLASGDVNINKFDFYIQHHDEDKEKSQHSATKYLPKLFSEKGVTNVCILAEPGLGSTTLLKKTAFNWATDEKFLPEFSLVVYLNVPSWEVKSMTTLIAEQYNIIDDSTKVALQHFLIEYSENVLYLLESDQALANRTLPNNETYKPSSILIAKSNPKLDKHTMLDLLPLRKPQINKFASRANDKLLEIETIRKSSLAPLLKVPCLLDILLHTWNGGSLTDPNNIEPLILSIWKHSLLDSKKAISQFITNYWRAHLTEMSSCHLERFLKSPYTFITELAKISKKSEKLEISHKELEQVENKLVAENDNDPLVFLPYACRNLLFFNNAPDSKSITFRNTLIREYFLNKSEHIMNPTKDNNPAL